MAEMEEFNEKQKYVEAVYQQAGGDGMPDMGGMAGAAGASNGCFRAGPTIEEVDYKPFYIQRATIPKHK